MKDKNTKLTVEEALDIIRRGGMIIMTDDEDRENEGDLVCAARHAGPEAVNFMASRGKGLLCCTLEKELCERAGLVLMDTNGGPESLLGTNFCISVDAIKGCTTGVSASDRSITIKRLAAADCRPGDFARPGHLFPIMEAEGGLAARQGHTEATVELCRQAGLEGAALICEILDDDGTMARWDRLNEMARDWDMGILTIADLVEWLDRKKDQADQILTSESLPVRLPTERGQFEMEFLDTHEGDSTTGGDHISLIRLKDYPDSAEHPEGPLVRIHSECLTGDLFASSRCDCGKQLAESQRLIEEEGEGYLIYLRQEGRGIGLRAKTEAYRLQDKGLDTLEANLELGYEADSRSYKTAAAYLKKKGLSRIRLLTNNPDKIGQLEAEGLKVSRVPLVVEPGVHSRRYMETKKEKMGHLSA